MRLGVDVGGTNTDAALFDNRGVVASVKTPTTADVGGGINDAIRKVLGTDPRSRDLIRAVVIGTTHFTNAFVERKRLNEVGVIRLCLPAARDLAPMAGWPDELRRRMGNCVHLVPGGHEFDGREIAPFDAAIVRDAARSIRARGLRGVAISSVCSPMNSDMECRAAEVVLDEVPDAAITLSSDIGRIGLIERENATIMNAALADLSSHVIQAIREALLGLGIDAPFYLSQNDGTLMEADHAQRYPVMTFSSGPTNSMRGAAWLSGVRDGIVVDIGGTTTDVGALVGGYPRESSLPVDIGGVRTNFRMPDVVAIGLGGGSVVTNGRGLRIGPESVGFRLTEKAMVFGGDILTATDIVVAAGHVELGDRRRVHSLGAHLVERALARMNAMVEDVVDAVKTSAGDLPVVLVGGGSVLVTDDLRGAERIVVPERSGEANAIGAAMAQVGGVFDHVFSYRDTPRSEAVAIARGEAFRRVVEAGGDEDSLEIVEFEEIPLAYSGNDSVRIRVKAVSDLVAQRAEPTRADPLSGASGPKA